MQKLLHSVGGLDNLCKIADNFMYNPLLVLTSFISADVFEQNKPK